MTAGFSVWAVIVRGQSQNFTGTPARFDARS